MGRLILFLALAGALLILFLTVAGALLAPNRVAAHAGEPRHEPLQVGPYLMEVGFSTWPIRSERSVDITFEPIDSPFEPGAGIAGKSGTVTLIAPNGEEFGPVALPRHPRFRELWGLDLIALPAEGEWTIVLTVDGPLGAGTGRLQGVAVEERPGPPAAAAWLVGVLPLGFLLWLIARAWRRVRPLTAPEARSWV